MCFEHLSMWFLKESSLPQSVSSVDIDICWYDRSLLAVCTVLPGWWSGSSEIGFHIQYIASRLYVPCLRQSLPLFEWVWYLLFHRCWRRLSLIRSSSPASLPLRCVAEIGCWMYLFRSRVLYMRLDLLNVVDTFVRLRWLYDYDTLEKDMRWCTREHISHLRCSVCLGCFSTSSISLVAWGRLMHVLDRMWRPIRSRVPFKKTVKISWNIDFSI